MTTTPEPLTAAVSLWRNAADQVLEIAEAAVPLSEDQFATMSFDGPAGGGDREVAPMPAEDAVNARVDAYLGHSDSVLDQIAATSKAGQPSSVLEESIPVLLAGIELSQALMAASQDRDESVRTLGVSDDDGPVRLSGSRAVLDEFGAAALGQAPAVIELPKELVAKFEALEDAGGKEVWEIGKDATLLAALKYGVDKAVSKGSEDVQKAFEAAKKALHWLKDAAVRIVEWVVNKMRNLLPEQFRKTFDDKVKDIKDKISEGAEDLLGDVLGKIWGRDSAEEAWGTALQTKVDLTDAESRLPTVISGQITRIGYVSRTRKGVKTVSSILTSIAAGLGLGLDIQIILAALALVLVGVVCAQLWDGFNDIEDLVPSPA